MLTEIKLDCYPKKAPVYVSNLVDNSILEFLLLFRFLCRFIEFQSVWNYTVGLIKLKVRLKDVSS